MVASFEQLKTSHSWRAIFGCPGRFVLTGGPSSLSIEDLAGSNSQIGKHSSSNAKDPVWVAGITGGGIISFEKPGNTFIHTLNTKEGFARKLADLGIESA